MHSRGFQRGHGSCIGTPGRMEYRKFARAEKKDGFVFVRDFSIMWGITIWGVCEIPRKFWISLIVEATYKTRLTSPIVNSVFDGTWIPFFFFFLNNKLINNRCEINKQKSYQKGKSQSFTQENKKLLTKKNLQKLKARIPPFLNLLIFYPLFFTNKGFWESGTLGYCAFAL